MAPVPSSRIARGTPAFRRMSLALFLAGFSTFGLLYCVQPLLPQFARHFGVSPAESALPLSLTTGALAVAIVAAGAFSQAIGRRGLMFASMGLAAILNLAAALAPDWTLLLAARALEGLALGGVPAVAMAYLSEEMEPADLAGAMGLYIAGTAFGGMMGRVGMGLLTELGSWRIAMAGIGLVGLAAALAFIRLLPPSRNFERQGGFDPGFHLGAWGRHLRNARLRRLFVVAFALMGVFVTLFNYATFRLEAAPYGLSETEVSLLFLVYALGMVSSSLAGRMIDRLGSRTVLALGFAVMTCGVVLTLARPLGVIALGLALVTGAFFVAHAVAGGWVGRLAEGAKGHASALYMLFYYLGSSLVGGAGGWFWEHGGWPAVAGLTAGLCVAGGLVALALRTDAPSSALPSGGAP
ncbi:MFS transporter [Phenylobacterium sp.]|jgi:YNFM family putative membrane transporter|uniref:MFS transporter n=1 Tax=Phenylobacterium sp. TaxID=1871053 RepID=UPI003783D915